MFSLIPQVGPIVEVDNEEVNIYAPAVIRGHSPGTKAFRIYCGGWNSSKSKVDRVYLTSTYAFQEFSPLEQIISPPPSWLGINDFSLARPSPRFYVAAATLSGAGQLDDPEADNRVGILTSKDGIVWNFEGIVTPHGLENPGKMSRPIIRRSNGFWRLWCEVEWGKFITPPGQVPAKREHYDLIYFLGSKPNEVIPLDFDAMDRVQPEGTQWYDADFCEATQGNLFLYRENWLPGTPWRINWTADDSYASFPYARFPPGQVLPIDPQGIWKGGVTNGCWVQETEGALPSGVMFGLAPGPGVEGEKLGYASISWALAPKIFPK